ncbi:hypothetical protein ACFYO7_19830 [Nocardia salmonicida]
MSNAGMRWSSGMETGNWLEPGDVLTLTLDDIGEVEHLITS